MNYDEKTKDWDAKIFESGIPRPKYRPFSRRAGTYWRLGIQKVKPKIKREIERTKVRWKIKPK